MSAKKQTIRLEEDSIAVRAVLDSMGEGLITIDAEGIITAVNPYALNALGYEEHELLGQWFSGAVIATDQHRIPLPHMTRPIVRALTSGEAISDYTYYLRKDGSLMPVFLTVSPIIISGRPSGAIELFRDITSDKQLDFAKDEFVSLASHQLRTPASGVKAILSMVLDEDFGGLNEHQRRYLLKAVQGNDRQLQIIEDILNIAQIDSGRMELEPERIDIVRLMQDTLTEQASQFRYREQTLIFEDSQPVLSWVDSGRIRMAFDNILTNASKYTSPGGSITVKVTKTDTMALVSITDTGVGIAQADITRLFKKFARVDNELSTLVGGSGLGLYLAHSIVELHKGSITVRSVVGNGSTFCISLPIALG